MMDWLDEIEKRVDCLQPYDMDLISEVLRLNHERNVLCEVMDSFLANVGIIRKDALPSPPELIMYLQEDAEEMVLRLREELSAFRKSEKELSDAYLRIRELVGAWDTKPGGEDRFEVTEAAVKRLRDENELLQRRISELTNVPWLGNATTRELIGELAARAEIGGYAWHKGVE